MPRGCWGCERRPLVYSDPVTKDIPPDLQSAVAERYELRRVLGQGGMATVYLAYDGKHRREVALKVLVPGLAAFLGVERFLREIQTAARLTRSEEHTSELQSLAYLVCRLLLEKKKYSNKH